MGCAARAAFTGAATTTTFARPTSPATASFTASTPTHIRKWSPTVNRSTVPKEAWCCGVSKKPPACGAPQVSIDNRLPHATAPQLAGHDTRECIYVGFLPSVALNEQYVRKQALALQQNFAPPAYCDDSKQPADRDWDLATEPLTDLQRSLLLLLE